MDNKISTLSTSSPGIYFQNQPRLPLSLSSFSELPGPIRGPWTLAFLLGFGVLNFKWLPQKYILFSFHSFAKIYVSSGLFCPRFSSDALFNRCFEKLYNLQNCTDIKL